MSELKDTKKIKQFEPDPNSQNSLFWHHKNKKKRPLDQIRYEARIEGDMENIWFFAI